MSLVQPEFLIGDGTFASAPRLFCQQYSLLAQVRGFNMVVLDCLLPSKTRAAYDSMFDVISGLVPGLSCFQFFHFCV